MYFESRFALRRGSGVVGEEGEPWEDRGISGWNQRFCGGGDPVQRGNFGAVSVGNHTSAVGGEPPFGPERSHGGRLAVLGRINGCPPIGISAVELGRREALYDDHGSAAVGATPGSTRAAWTPMDGYGWSSRLDTKQLPTQRQHAAAMTAGKKAKEADADKATRDVCAAGKRRRNSSTDSVRSRFLFLCARSRQRNVTWPSANDTRRRLEIAIRCV